MSPSPDSPLADFKRFGEFLQRINGGLLVALVIVGFFLVMLLVLPEGWPLFAILLGIGAVIAFRLEKRESQGYPDKMEARPTDIEADGRSRIFGPDMQIENVPTITSHPVGVVLIIGLGLILLGRLPGFVFFLFGAIVLGGLIGAVLWWKHR